MDTAQALVSAAPMNVVEFHTWNSLARIIDTLLTELGLRAWLKSSGGKGLHVVVPLGARLDYDTVKDFSQAAERHMARCQTPSAAFRRAPWPVSAS